MLARAEIYMLIFYCECINILILMLQISHTDYMIFVTLIF